MKKWTKVVLAASLASLHLMLSLYFLNEVRDVAEYTGTKIAQTFGKKEPFATEEMKEIQNSATNLVTDNRILITIISLPIIPFLESEISSLNKWLVYDPLLAGEIDMKDFKFRSNLSSIVFVFLNSLTLFLMIWGLISIISKASKRRAG